MLGGGKTVKFTPLLATPLTVTTTLPFVAPTGTVVRMVGGFQELMTAGVPLKVTVSGVGPNPDPLIVTEVPTEFAFGDKLLMKGMTVKTTPLLARPPTLTNTFPVVAVLGTENVIVLLFQVVGVIERPLRRTVLEP